MKPRSLLFASFLLMLSAALLAQPSVKSLKVDYKSSPLGIDNPRPRLSWMIESDQMNTMQDSYEIRAALSVKDLAKGRNLLWETGKVVFFPEYPCGIRWSSTSIIPADLLAGKDQRQSRKIKQMERVGLLGDGGYAWHGVGG